VFFNLVIFKVPLSADSQLARTGKCRLVATMMIAGYFLPQARETPGYGFGSKVTPIRFSLRQTTRHGR
jgi:hypothetical protein